MYKTYDFECKACSAVFTDTVEGCDGKPEECPACGAVDNFLKLPAAPLSLYTIIPSYPGCKKHKAGTQHTHNRAAEKSDRQISMAGTGGIKNGS